jgi:hypothetical protein
LAFDVATKKLAGPPDEWTALTGFFSSWSLAYEHDFV